MSTWQGYVDFMKGKGNLSDLMIVSSEDGASWASTPNFLLREYKATIIQEVGFVYLLYFVITIFYIYRMDQRWKK